MSFWKKAFVFFLLLLVLDGLIGLFLWAQLQQFLSGSESMTREIGLQIADEMAQGNPIRGAIYRNAISKEPRIGYFVIADYRNGYRSGIINVTSLKDGASNVSDYLRRHGDNDTLAYLLRPQQGFPGEHLHVVSAAFVPPNRSADQTPIGTLKVAYVVPGFPYGRGFLKLWFLLSAVFFVGGIVLWVGLFSSRDSWTPSLDVDISPLPPLKKPDPKDDLAWLEEEMSNPKAVVVDEKGRPWRLLFNDEDLEGWKVQGNWYVTEEQICGQPWRSSLISTAIKSDSNYIFRVEAKKISGPDGFILLFTCDGKSYIWVLGGWKNERSEVAGYPSTASTDKIEVNLWYKVELKVEAQAISGFVNDKKVWALARNEMSTPSPEVGFQHGIGIAVWNTLTMFRNIRYLAL